MNVFHIIWCTEVRGCRHRGVLHWSTSPIGYLHASTTQSTHAFYNGGTVRSTFVLAMDGAPRLTTKTPNITGLLLVFYGINITPEKPRLRQLFITVISFRFLLHSEGAIQPWPWSTDHLWGGEPQNNYVLPLQGTQPGHSRRENACLNNGTPNKGGGKRVILGNRVLRDTHITC